jgi:hypothetical protein
MGNLQEELARFNAINKYTEKLLSEQAPPPPEDPNAAPPPADPAADPAAPPADPNAMPPLPPDGEAAPPAGDEPAPDADPLAGEEPAPEAEPSADDTTEELDITDLVNMTKDIKKQLDATQNKDTGSVEKMDAVFSKLGELEAKLGEMDSVLAKIDQLGAQIQQVKPKTPVEKLEMRSLDSYPFNKKPDEFFAEKQGEMEKSGKNEYVLTKGDVENYGKNEIMKSFNPKADENPYNF